MHLHLWLAKHLHNNKEFCYQNKYFYQSGNAIKETVLNRVKCCFCYNITLFVAIWFAISTYDLTFIKNNCLQIAPRLLKVGKSIL